MKKKILAIAVIMLCLPVFVQGTVAYFTADDTATNVFTTSGIDIVLEEWADEAQTIPFGDKYEDNTVALMPGSQLTKVVTVKNVEEIAYIRAVCHITVTKFYDDTCEVLLDSFDPDDTEELNRIIDITGKDEKWDYADGVYYYSEALPKGESTKPLFTKVTFNGPEMTNEYQNCEVKIEITAQGLQRDNIELAQGQEVYELAAWAKAFAAIE